MQQLRRTPVVVGTLLGVLVFVLALTGCGSKADDPSLEVQTLMLPNTEPLIIPEANPGGQESGIQFALGDTFNEVQSGVHLMLSYDSTANAFKGTVKNTTGNTMREVRIRVQLSTGTDWVLTNVLDLAPSQVRHVTISVGSEPFTSWSAHPEVN